MSKVADLLPQHVRAHVGWTGSDQDRSRLFDAAQWLSDYRPGELGSTGRMKNVNLDLSRGQDFLKSEDKYDSVILHHVFAGFPHTGYQDSEPQKQALAELSSRSKRNRIALGRSPHHSPEAWRNALVNSSAKRVFAFGHGTEVSGDFLGDVPGYSRHEAPFGTVYEKSDVAKAFHIIKDITDAEGHLHSGKTGEFESKSESDSYKDATKQWVTQRLDLAAMMGREPHPDDVFLLKHGRFFEPKPMPAKYAESVKENSQPKLCFMNALHMATRHPELTYTEGYAHMGVIPVHHAWLTDKEGNAYDPTWKDVTHGKAYFGVAMPLNLATNSMLSHGTYGALYKESPRRRKKLIHLRDLMDPQPKPEKPKAKKKTMTAGELVTKTETIGDLVKYGVVTDALGRKQMHDQLGRFTSRATEAGVPESVANNDDDRPVAVFFGGTPASGKSALVKVLTGGEINRYESGPTIGKRPRWTRKVKLEPVDGFNDERVVDPDRHKKAMKGLYTPEKLPDGTRGPSGPRSMDDYNHLSQDAQLHALEYCRKLGYPNIQAFAMSLPHNHGKKLEDAQTAKDFFGGGLTHEMSSEMAARQFRAYIDDPQPKSFIFDAVGNPDKYEQMMGACLDRGMRVVYHHAAADLETNHENDYWRERTVGPEVILHGHAKSMKTLDRMGHLFKAWKAQGKPVEMLVTKTNTEAQRQGAIRRGWSKTGPTPGSAADALPKKV